MQKKKILVWCDDPPEDPVISIFAGCLANHDRAHSPVSIVIIDLVVLQCSFFAATVGCTIIFGSGLTHVSLFLVTSVLRVTSTHQRHTR